MYKFVTITIGAAGLAAATASAQGFSDDGAGFYAQGGYQYLEIEPEGAESGVDSSGIFARAGFQFTRNFAIEADLATGIDDGEFDFNVDEDDFDLDDNNDGDFNDLIAATGDIQLNYLTGIYGRAIFPLNDQLDVSARAGYAFVDIDADVVTPGGTTLGTVEDSEDGAAFGAAITYDFAPNWQVRGDYTYYAFDNTDTNGLTVGVGYKF